MFCYCRRPPVDDAEGVEPVPDSEDHRPDPSHAAPNAPGGSRVIDVFNRLLLLLHLRKHQNADMIELQPSTTAVVVPSTSLPQQSSSPNNVASVGPCDPFAARPASLFAVVPPPVDTSTALPPPSSSDPSSTSSLASPVRYASSPVPHVPSLSGFSSASPVPDSHSWTSQIDDLSPLYPLSPDEVAMVRKHRRQQGRSAVAPGTLNEPSRENDATVLLPQPFSVSLSQQSSSSIQSTNDSDPLGAGVPLSATGAVHGLEMDAQLSTLLSLPGQPANSPNALQADHVLLPEHENPWASD
ncbi:hypothetical protein HYDPIDRAFT_111469 [Hydnomerulius pinastri MD-312]|uniref:Uncharacterized protein n=1 Tax=Hydnomerulius pinastri MD-312 TaxID=994086 RepID=A0A0C9WFH1_9AGAM|nr:hypothetical protein HYDPIDRAFT_111469 [Hydnomerulius pinastri MD-312]